MKRTKGIKRDVRVFKDWNWLGIPKRIFGSFAEWIFEFWKLYLRNFRFIRWDFIGSSWSYEEMCRKQII